MNTYRQFDKPLRSMVRFGGVALRWCLVLCFVLTAGQTQAQLSSPDANCTVILLNRSAQLGPDGVVAIPNVPVQPGYYRVRATCVDSSTTIFGQTAYFVLNPNGPTQIPPITYGAQSPVPISLTVTGSPTTLTTKGETVQLSAIITLPDGSKTNWSTPALGTLWTSSNPNIASVNPNGLVSAQARGTAIIQANNEGILGTFIVTILIPNDADSDGMTDEFERANNLNPNNSGDAAQDLDVDGLTNLEEFQRGTNLRLGDTDGDGIGDGSEAQLGTNPVRADTDSDGLTDGEEVSRSFNPLAADTDGDGIADGLELRLQLNPLVANPITTVQGRVVDTNGAPTAGVTVTLFDILTAQTDNTGSFQVQNVPASLGPITASAVVVRVGRVFNGSSQPVAAQVNGITDVGTIQLVLDSGSVVGVVTDPLDNPVAGVNITVTAGSDVRVAVTDAGGNYRVRSMTAGNLIVTGRDPNTGLRAFVTGQLVQNASAIVNLRLSPAGSVGGTVINTDTITPVGPGVEVALSVGNLSTITDPLGKYRFDFVPLGSYNANATDANGNRGRSSGNISATDQVRVSDITFLGKGVVRGVVRDGALNPVQNANVRLNSQSVFGGSASAVTDVLGRFALSNIFIGPFNVSAEDPVTRFAGFGSGLVESDGQSVTNDITLAGSGSITGIVFRANGSTPVPNLEVVLSPSGRRATTDGQGQFLFNLVPFGNYSLSVVDPATGDRAQAGGVSVSTQDELEQQNLILNGIGSVSVTVVNGANAAVSGANVSLTSQTVFGGSQSGISQVGGLVTFANVLAGAFSVSANDPVTGLSGTTTGGVADGGGASVTVQLQSAGSVLGTVFAADGTTPVSGVTVRINGQVNRQQITGGNGQFRFDVLPTSTYSLDARDANGNLRARATGVVVSSQGQEVTRNLTLIGTGTVSGVVRKPDATLAPGFAVSLQSQAPEYGGSFFTYADVNGVYQIGNVPVGPFTANSSGQTGSTQYFGAVSGVVLSNLHAVTANINLAANVIPVNGDPANPASISPILTLYDANNFVYNLTGLGSIQDGSVSVFGGDFSTNRGANILDVLVGGVPSRFFGQSSSVGQAGRELVIVHAGLGGLDVVRKAYVPTNGYFVRYLDVFTNPTPNAITIDVRLTSHFRFISKVQGGFTFNRDPRIITTSSGDSALVVTNTGDADHWVMVDDDDDGDPFQITTLPAIVDVFDGTNAPRPVNETDFTVNFARNFGRLVKQWNSVTIAPGASAVFLHFTAEQVTRSGAIASALRLSQLPPEALLGISAAELAVIQNFVPPSGGVSEVPALPSLAGTVNGAVLSGDNVSPIASSTVRFQSTNPLFGRTFNDNSDGLGKFGFAGALNSHGNSRPVPVDGFTLVATHPLTGILSPVVPGSFPLGLTTATQNVVFADSGVLAGTVRRHNNVVVSSGTVRITGSQLLNAINLAIAANGAYRVNGLPADTYSLVATAPIAGGSDLTGVASAPVLAGQTNITDIFIEPTGIINGTLRRQNNAVVVNLTVTLRGPNNFTRTTVTDTGGQFNFTDVPAGPVTLEAYDPASNTAARSGSTVLTDQTVTQNLTLSAGGTVAGVVRNPSSVPVVGAQVTLTSSLGTQNGVTGPNGNYQFDLVPLGEVTVVAVDAGTSLRGRSAGNLGVSGQTLNLDIQLQVSGSIAGTIRRPDGTTPVSGATVSLSSLGMSTVSDANGQYGFDFVPAGSFTVTASDPAKGESASVSGNLTVNGSALTVNVALRPVLVINNVTVTEGNVGTTSAVFEVTLSSPSASSVGVSYATASGTAFGVTDFQTKSGNLTFVAGVQTQTVSVAVNGDVTIEPTENFSVNLSLPVNATIGDASGAGTISNDDGFPGQINHFTWAAIPSPQFANQPFPVKVTAKDAFGNTLSNFAGPVSLEGLAVSGSVAKQILGSPGHTANGGGNYTLGYAFTPNTNIVVTHIRHYWGGKVSIWTDTGTLVASQEVTSAPGVWLETPLTVPVNLSAGVRYRVGAFTSGGSYFLRYDASALFADGTIDGSYQIDGDAFPTTPDGARWWLVDLKYTVGVQGAVPLTPTVSGNFTDGSWAGNVTVSTLNSNLVLRAFDNDGHSGLSSGFEVQFRDDVAVYVSDSPDPVDSGAALTYTVTVTNTGPSEATGVVVTNLIPASVTLGPVNAASGSTSVNGRTVTWTLGALASGSSQIMTIQVTPTVSGVITNLAGVTRSGPDGTTENNLAVTLTSVLLPAITISDVNLTEGNTGTKDAIFEVKLSYPSGQIVTVNFASSNGTATATQDYLATNGVVTFSPGETSKPVVVRILGDVSTEANETFSVRLTGAAAATIGDNQGVATILNDDGLPGQVDHFDWAAIASPQYVDVPFPVTITAKDAFGATVAGFTGPVNLSGLPTGVDTNVILGNLVPDFSSSGNYTFGYSFTPNTNLTVTHVRSYSGTKVSIWTDAGALLVSQAVVSTPGTWVETPLTTPIVLQAGTRYRVAMYTGGGSYYYRFDGVASFPHGTIHQSYQRSGDLFPTTPDSVRWWFVDLKYVAGDNAPIPISPTVSGNFVNGVWTGNMTVQAGHAAMSLFANDGDGHYSPSASFAALYQNDLSVTLADSPDPVGAGENLVYTVVVSNTGPASASNVVLTNFLPASVAFVNATTTQGSTALAGRTLTATLGVLPGGGTATVSINVTTTTSGQITNVAGVTREGTDASEANNVARTVTTVLLPTVTILDTSVNEGDTGTSDAVFTVQLSFPSSQTVTVNYGTTNGTAQAGSDYNSTNGSVIFFAGQTSKTVIVKARGDTQVEPNETFVVGLANPGNAAIADGQATGLVLNDDGLPGAIDHFDWAAISSPQYVGQSFPVTLTAKDFYNETVTGYAGPVNLTAMRGGVLTNTILGDVVHAFNSTGNHTMGYAFTPNTNLTVTHVRSYSGTKVSIWTDAGALVASQPVVSSPGSWVETPLATPVQLQAGTRYRVAFYTGGGGGSYYYRNDGTTSFPYGTIDQGYEASGDTFPTIGDGIFWWFVDLKYTVGDQTLIPISPVISGSFVNGVWTGNLTVLEPNTNLVLHAQAATGHSGDANPIVVALQNDIGLAASVNPTVADVASNLTYSITVSNSGPGVATAVVLTNQLTGPANLLSVTTSQGNITTNGNRLVFNFGSLASGSFVSVTIVVRPAVDGIMLTNLCTVVRGEPDSFAGNNSALIVTPVRYLLGGSGRVAIYGAENNATWRSDVKNKIQATGLFTVVDEFRVTGGDPVPTLAELLTYDAVLVYSDSSFNNSTALGNVLADYVDQGGGVVVATFALDGALQGRLISGSYLPYVSGSGGGGGFQTLVKDDPDHPILNGVNTFNGGSSSYQSSVAVAPGATLIAHWSNNRPLVATKVAVNGRVAGLNFFPPSSDARSDFWTASTDGDQLLANALAWASGSGAAVPDDVALTVTDTPDPVGLGTNVTYTLTVSNTGPSLATGVVVSNVPPANASLVSFSSSQGSSANVGGVVVFEVGNLPAGAIATLTVLVQATNVGTITNVATVARAEPDGYLPNNLVASFTAVQVPTISIVDASVSEGNSGTTNLTATVRLSVASPLTVSAAFATADNSAAAGNDYVANSGAVIFPPGVTTQTIVVVVNGDLLNELDEVFNINLSNPTNASILDGFSVNTILNDDALPTIAINDVVVTEGDTGTTNAIFEVTLSAPSGRSVTVSYQAANSSAQGGVDFHPTNNTLTFLTGETSKPVVVRVIGETAIEADETFMVNLSSANNATIFDNQGVGTILNDDGLPGAIDHFEIGSIPSPQYVNVPFPVTITAKDANGTTVPGYVGTVNLSANPVGASTNVILGNVAHTSISSGNYTMGYSFTPNTNLTVTHVRSYYGNKVSIWTDSGNLIASQSVSSTPGTWVETPLTTPVVLQAGVRYRVGTYNPGLSYYWRSDGPGSFAYGTIDQSYNRTGDGFPNGSDSARWWFVDLKYTVGDQTAVPILPTVSGNFIGGVWTGDVTVLAPHTNVILRARAGSGHSGEANAIAVLIQNDLELTAVTDQATADVRSNLTYSISVTNSGPSGATAVVVTNELPDAVNLVSMTSSQGSFTSVGNRIVFNLGSLAGGATATATIVVKPVVDGITLSNRCTIVRGETDGFAGNNSVLLRTPVRSLIGVGVRVAVYAAENSESWRTDVRNKIQGAGAFTQVDQFRILSGDPVPTLAQLQQYDAVFVFANSSFNDGTAVGNVLADYVDQGGGVVMATFALGSGYLGGRFVSGGYLPFTTGSSSSGTTLTMIKDSASHPILSGVNTFSGGSSSYHNVVNLASGAEQIARWSNNRPLVATRTPASGRVVGLNMFPPSSDERNDLWTASTDGARLMANALAWSSGKVGVVPDDVSLSVTDSPDPVGVGTNVTYTLTVSNTGPSTANSVVVSNITPANVSLVSFNASQGSSLNANGVVVFSLGSVAAGASVNLTVSVQATNAGTITNVATIVRAEPDGYTPNNRVVSLTSVQVPAISINDVNSLEGNAGVTNLVATVRLTVASPNVVSVAYATSDNGANAGSDYLATNGVVVFPPGVTTQTVAVVVNGDSLNEFDEGFSISLFNPTNAILSDGFSFNTIVNDDPLPVIAISDAVVTERNTGTTNAAFEITLSPVSGRAVTVYYETLNDTALAGSDYQSTNDSVTFLPGETSKTVIVRVNGETVIEPDETFAVNLYSVDYASYGDDQGLGAIINDDGFPGQINHFVFAPVASPQIVGTPFPISVTAKDVFGTTVSNYAGPANFTAGEVGADAEMILGNLVHDSSYSGANYTYGYAFTPSANLLVTHMRSYFGSKVSIWTDGGVLVASEPVSGAQGAWTETALATPVVLEAGSRYRLGVLASANVYYRFDGSSAFPHGTIDQSYQQFGDNFPDDDDSVRWWFVDLKYRVEMPVPVSPAIAGTFTDGVWNGLVAVLAPGNNLTLRANDGDGHAGSANAIVAETENDLEAFIVSDTDPVDVRSNLTYSVTITNSGPNPSTGVVLTNLLPPTLYLVSWSTPQGNANVAGQLITFNLGTLAAEDAVTVQIEVRPNADGRITNTVSVGRTEAEGYLANNSASEVTRVEVPVTSSSFRIVSLSANGASAVEVDPLTGDDRGGLVVSSERAFLTGDDDTAGFKAGDLSAGVGVGLQLDAMVGDLRTEKIYSLSDGFELIENGGGVVTTLAELDSNTGLPTGEEIVLSTPINMNGNPGGSAGFGIFSGYGQIVLLNGYHAYRVALPSGVVTDLGAMSTPFHRSSENWAFWGLAEQFDGETYVVYVEDSTRIVRARMPDGQVSLIANFDDLSDMASINASVMRSRWYFHHENDSQFFDGNEVLGFANAVFEASSIVGLGDDLILSVAADPNPVAVGGEVTYTLTVSNTGPSLATGVVVSNVPPAGLNVTSFGASQGTSATHGGVVVFELGNVPAGSSVTMTVVVQTDSLGVITSVATVTRGEQDAYTPNNRVVSHIEVALPSIFIANLNEGVFEGDNGTTNLQIIVQLSGPSPDTISVDFATYDNGAIDGQDYLGTNGTLVFLPGQTEQIIQVPVLGDVLNEFDEAIYVELFNPFNANVIDGETYPTIFNDDPLPQVSIDDVAMVEGNTGITPFEFTVTLSEPSALFVTVNYQIGNGSAVAGADFSGLTGNVVFEPGETVQTITVNVIGETMIETNETFIVDLTFANNGDLADDTGVGTIENDDGFAGEVDHFDWAVIASPQEANVPFAATITAKDAFGATVTTFTGPVDIHAAVPGTESRTIVGSPAHTATSVANYTLGFAFTPAENITVTHVRHYAGTKVSIWTDNGTLLVSQPVVSTPGTWTETALAVPVTLAGGSRYRVAFYTGGNVTYYYNFARPSAFPDGTVDGYSEGPGDAFPGSFGSSSLLYMVDLRYDADASVAVPLSPMVSGSFSGGMWTGNLTVQAAANGIRLMADDGDGHLGRSVAFNVAAGRAVSPVVPLVVSLRRSSGAVELEVTGPKGGQCLIETSADLRNWSPLCTNSFESGHSLIVDPNGGSASSRFYRARLQP